MSTPHFTVGQKATWTKTISEADVQTFAGLVGDFNPIHIDAEFAKRGRFGERVAHGILTAGLISAAIGMRLPGPGGICLAQTMRFTKPVRIGDTITAAVEVLRYRPGRRLLTLHTTCTNQRGEIVVDGEALVLADPVPE